MAFNTFTKAGTKAGKVFLGVFAVSAVCALSACGQFGASGIGQAKPQLVAEPDSSSLMLADAADRAARSLESLAAVEQVRTPSASAAAAMIPNAPIELQKAVTFSWNGPVEPVARDLAARAGYSFRTVGNQPPAPITVALDITNEPIVQVLRDLGLQMGSRGDLKLDANRRTVEIIYAATVNQPTANSSTMLNSSMPGQDMSANQPKRTKKKR